MSRREDLGKIEQLTQLMLDHRLTRLRETAEQRDKSMMQLSAIAAGAAPADLPTVTGEVVGLAYQRWADIRRSELNAVIARQTADWLEARAEASTAFGRLQAIKGISERLPEK